MRILVGMGLVMHTVVANMVSTIVVHWVTRRMMLVNPRIGLGYVMHSMSIIVHRVMWRSRIVMVVSRVPQAWYVSVSNLWGMK